MSKRVVVNPILAKMTATFPSQGKLALPTTKVDDKPRSIRAQFGASEKTPVVKMDGDIQVGLNAESERKDCAFEFMQFATPTRFERIYAGRKDNYGSTTINWAGHIQNRQFLDGSTAENGTDLVAIRKPFMSKQPHGGPTTHGHFKNSMEDHPSVGTPEFVVAENNEKHYLFRIRYLTNFLTVLIFIHPTKERQPVSLIRWVVEYDFTLRWEGGIPLQSNGLGQVKKGSVTNDAGDLAAVEALVNSPPTLLINQVANPNLMTSVSLPAADGRTFMPIGHPEVESSFFIP